METDEKHDESTSGLRYHLDDKQRPQFEQAVSPIHTRLDDRVQSQNEERHLKSFALTVQKTTTRHYASVAKAWGAQQKNQEAAKATLCKQKHKLTMLTTTEWDKLQRLATILEPCRYVPLEVRLQVSCSVVLPALRHLDRTMEVSDEDPAYM
ncbi:putative zinc finger BED domain-containing protein 1-like, partial [Scophthalmus maximus]